MITYHRAELKDIPTIQYIAYETWPETYREILSNAQMTYMLDMMYSEEVLSIQMESEEQIFYIAKKENETVGFVAFQYNYPEPKITKIHKIYLLPSAQGHGVGKALIDLAADHARSANNTQITLNVNKFNKALDFYKKIGFEVLKYQDFDIGRGYLMEDAIMVKAL